VRINEIGKDDEAVRHSKASDSGGGPMNYCSGLIELAGFFTLPST
jgi:hypothetical protein